MEVQIKTTNIEQNKLLLPKTDVVFQALFGTKGSERILGGLLTEILGYPVENISLEANQNLVREMPTEKLGILDLRANIGKDKTVNIEVQLINQQNMQARLLYYWSRIYGAQIKEGQDYKMLKKTIAILIVNYEMPELQEFKDSHTKWELLEKRKPNVLVFKNIEIHILEIPKLIKYNKETEERLGNWIEFLIKPESERVKMGAKKDKNLKEAVEKLEVISGDEKMRRIAELRLKYILDRNTDIKTGIEQGIKQERMHSEQKILEIVKKLLKLKMPIEQISQITGLSKDEIEKFNLS